MSGPYEDEQERRRRSRAVIEGAPDVIDVTTAPTRGVGDVVTLASGGAPMTIASIGSHAGVTIAKVVWLDEQGREHEMTVDARCLK